MITVMGMKKSYTGNVQKGLAAALIIGGIACVNAEPLLPLPENGLPTSPGDEIKRTDGSVITDIPDAVMKSTAPTPTIPSEVDIQNEGGSISYNSEQNALTYDGGGKNIKVRTNEGTELSAPHVSANLEKEIVELRGQIVIYNDAMLAKISGDGNSTTPNAQFNWKDDTIQARGVRAKINGMLVKGSKVIYGIDPTKKDAENKNGRRYIEIHDAYITTEDTESPSTWIGCGIMRIYPGDEGRISKLSIVTNDVEVRFPFPPFSHSLNPREGWMPEAGTRSIWGGYMLNRYGFLIGNRRTSGFMPTADYLATLHADIRTRRGVATGFDFEDLRMSKKHSEMTGLQTYLVFDRNPMINPSRGERQHTRHNRYRVALKTEWELPQNFDREGKWQANTNINILSDRYMLRDFFEELSRVDSSPDNTVRIERRTKDTHSMVYTRFAPNNFYATDERLEGTFYRVRQPLFNTGITYETRNSAGVMHQYLPIDERISYQNTLAQLRDPSLRAYYERLLNTSSYMRVNSVHEFTTSKKAFNFLNITPKAGFGYSGYYGVDEVSSESRCIGYLGVDFDIKFNKKYNNFRFTPLGYDKLLHVIHPYASLSHTNLSSSRGLLPQVDSWSSALGSSTNSPMPLDLIAFNGVDSWDSWSVWRLGMRNSFTTTVDGENVRLLDVNTFIDYNLDNPLTESEYSNLYTRATLNLTKQTRFYMETQTPTFKNGDGYNRYNINVATMPFAWLETHLGWRYFKGHPIFQDSEQLETKFNVRFNERYTAAVRLTWDFTYERMPVQQYSLFRNVGPWYIGATIFVRDNGGKKEEGFGISFTLSETGTALPVDL